MEESENRKLRLKAMRMEASEAESIPNTCSSIESVHLSNPLTEPVLESAPVAARFDYYSDPLASYTGNRRKSQKTYQNLVPPTISDCSGPANFNMPPSSCQQYNQSHSSDQRMYEAPLSHNSSGTWRSPIGMARPRPQQHGTPPATWNRPGGTAGYGRVGGFPPNPPMVGGFPPNSPMVGVFPPNSPMVDGFRPNPPMVGNFIPSSSTVGGFRPNSPIVSGFPPYSPTVGGFPSPGFGRGGDPSPGSGSGRGYQINNNPYPNFGQGSNPNYNIGRSNRSQFNNPIPGFGRGGGPRPNTGRNSRHGFNNRPGHGSGQGHGRNQCGHGVASARERPDLFYNRSMLEDPWRLLKPVVRKITVEEERGSSQSWLPKSISRKKDTVPDAVTGARYGFSLAESLAASVEEATALAAFYNAVAATDDVKNG